MADVCNKELIEKIRKQILDDMDKFKDLIPPPRKMVVQRPNQWQMQLRPMAAVSEGVEPVFVKEYTRTLLVSREELECLKSKLTEQEIRDLRFRVIGVGSALFFSQGKITDPGT